MFRLYIEIISYNKKSWILKLLKKSFLKKTVSNITNLIILFPYFKNCPVKHDKIVISHDSYEVLIINHNTSRLSEEGDILKLTLDIEKIDLDGFLNKIADEKLGNNILVRELIKTANNCLNEEKKVELIQAILPIINEADLANQMYRTFIENGGESG